MIQQIRNTTASLDDILAQYRNDLAHLETELHKAVADYFEALAEEKIKEIQKSLP